MVFISGLINNYFYLLLYFRLLNVNVAQTTTADEKKLIILHKTKKIKTNNKI